MSSVPLSEQTKSVDKRVSLARPPARPPAHSQAALNDRAPSRLLSSSAAYGFENVTVAGKERKKEGRKKIKYNCKGREKWPPLCADPDNLSNLNSTALGGKHINSKPNQFRAPRPPPPHPRLFDFSSLSTFSYLFFHFFPRYNYVSGSKCNCKRVVCAWGGRVCIHRACVCLGREGWWW